MQRLPGMSSPSESGGNITGKRATVLGCLRMRAWALPDPLMAPPAQGTHRQCAWRPLAPPAPAHAAPHGRCTMLINDIVLGFSENSTSVEKVYSAPYIEDKVGAGAAWQCSLRTQGEEQRRVWSRSRPALAPASMQDCCFDATFMRGVITLVSDIFNVFLVLNLELQKVRAMPAALQCCIRSRGGACTRHRCVLATDTLPPGPCPGGSLSTARWTTHGCSTLRPRIACSHRLTWLRCAGPSLPATRPCARPSTVPDSCRCGPQASASASVQRGPVVHSGCCRCGNPARQPHRPVSTSHQAQAPLSCRRATAALEAINYPYFKFMFDACDVPY